MYTMVTFRTSALTVVLSLVPIGTADFSTPIELSSGRRSVGVRALNAAGISAGYTQAGPQRIIALWGPDGSRLSGPYLGGYSTEYHGINDFDQIVGTDDRRAFTGFIGGQGINLHALIPGDPSDSGASDINNHGAIVVVAWTNAGPDRSYLYDGTRMIALPPPDGSVYGVARALNNNAQVVGTADRGGQGDGRAILWEGGQAIELPPLPGFLYASAEDINDDGDVVGRSFDNGNNLRATLWSQGLVHDLGEMPGSYYAYKALAINQRGQVVGHAYQSTGGRRAFLWEDGVMTDLNDLIPPNSGWVIAGAFDINEHGWILAGAINPSGEPVGALLIPEHSELTASVDIKPGSCPNSFNRRSRGVLPVAVVGTSEFDVSMIDIESLVLTRADGVGGAVAPLSGPPGPPSRIEDVATPFEGERCDCHELQGDGVDDLSMKFDTQTLVAELELGGLPGGATIELVVSGRMLDGDNFSGVDCIRLVPPDGGEQESDLGDGETPTSDTQPKPTLAIGEPKENAESEDDSTSGSIEPAPLGCGGIMPSLLFATLAGMWLMTRHARSF